MIAFGIWVESEARYASVLRPTLAPVLEPDGMVLESTTDGCIFEAYEEILAAASSLSGLEALVLVRDDVELRDPQLLPKLRAALAQPGVAVVGAAGARNVTSLRWWEGDVVGRLDHAGGTIGVPCGGMEEAHVLDGGLLALAPAVLPALRPDRGFWSGAHGSEAELCWLARLAGGRVVVTDIALRRHADVRPAEDVAFLTADLRWRARWSYVEAAA